MTCGWDHAGRWFYDGWVGRDMSGDLYTPFPVKEEDKDLPQKVSPFSPLFSALPTLFPLFVQLSPDTSISLALHKAHREMSTNADLQLFINHPNSRLRHEQNLPIQVFAGWNGIAVMNPKPFFPPYNVRFRRGAPKSLLSMEWECQASESSFISWDFWKVCHRGAVRCRGHRPSGLLPARQGGIVDKADK